MGWIAAIIGLVGAIAALAMARDNQLGMSEAERLAELEDVEEQIRMW